MIELLILYAYQISLCDNEIKLYDGHKKHWRGEFERSTVQKEAEIAAVSRNYQSAIHEGAIKIF